MISTGTIVKDPIFVVDDESSIRDTLMGILQDEGYDVVPCADATELFHRMEEFEPVLVLLDIWLPGADGMKVLRDFKSRYPAIPVIMMSGHAGIEAAVTSIKMGAYDFLEKPLHLEVLLDKITGALTKKPRSKSEPLPSDTRLEIVQLKEEPVKGVAVLEESDIFQKTLKRDVVLNGTGLLSGRHTGMILSPLDADAGIQFQSLDGSLIKGNITSLENYNATITNSTFTANSTVLTNGNRHIRTVEHILAVLSMFGITNVLIKVDEEIPNIDGSAKDFVGMILGAGTVEQSSRTKVVAIRDKILIGKESTEEKYLYVEPMDGFEISMRINYPKPIFEQKYSFNPALQSFEKEIAPARSFNTLENIDMAQKMGKVGSGYLNSHIIMHEGKVINTDLRFPDEFVRHKILDLIGDLYLLGMQVRGRFVANMTSHGYNQAIVQKIYRSIFSGDA